MPERFLLKETLSLNPKEDLWLTYSGIAKLGSALDGDLCFCDRSPSDTLHFVKAACIILCTSDLLKELRLRFPQANCVALPDPRATFMDLGHRLLQANAVQVGIRVPRPLEVHPATAIGSGTLIHNDVRIDEGVQIGEQCVIHRGSWIQAGTLIRDNVVIGVEGINAYRGRDGRKRNFPHFAGVTIGENVEIGAGSILVCGILSTTSIGSHSTIGNLCNIGHGVEVGEKVWMSVGCLIGGHTRLDDGATLGMGSTIRDNIQIGKGAQIGMGSVVVKSVAANLSVFGNPARAMGPIQAGPNR
jgi:UDP-3-O-[3-hydroxymyristoyl] glucosamine N-acyltransferase